MDTINLDHLIVDATDYLCAQAYSTQYHNRILHHWKIMSDWFAAHPSYSNFDDQSLKDFFIDRLGISKLREATIEEQKFTIRASRMLLSYSQDQVAIFFRTSLFLVNSSVQNWFEKKNNWSI